MATASRVDMILESILPLIANAIATNEIFPISTNTVNRFLQGWNITAGWPDANEQDSIRYAAEDGGYTIAVNAVEPTRQSSQKWIDPPTVVLNDGSMRQEVARRSQRVQSTVWAATDTLRDEIADAIMQALGTDVAGGQWLMLPDGTKVRMQYVLGPRRTDEMIAEVQLKRADVLIDVDYGVLSAPVTYEEIDEAIATIAFPNRTLTITET
jgi:hypothetical protein